MSAALLRWLPLPVLVVGSLAAWGLAGERTPREAPAPPTPPPLVEVVEVVPEDVLLTVRTHGIVEPRTEIDLVAEIAGRVRAVSPALAAGGYFEAGDVLVELDPQDAALTLERAEAARLRSQSQAQLARARRVRLAALAKREVTSRARLEEAEHEERIAGARAREARAARDQARLDLERTRVHAPFAGRVRVKRADVGQFVARGTPLARIYATDYAEVRLPVPGSELAWLELEPGGVGDERGPVVRLRAHHAGLSAQWTGRIVRIEGEIAARSRMLHLVARVEDPERRHPDSTGPPLIVGLFVEAEIVGRTFQDLFVLPRSALWNNDEVLVVDSGNRLRRRRLDLLRIEWDRLLVRSGLAPGERVCVSALGPEPGREVRAALAGRPPVATVSAGPRP